MSHHVSLSARRRQHVRSILTQQSGVLIDDRKLMRMGESNSGVAEVELEKRQHSHEKEDE